MKSQISLIDLENKLIQAQQELKKTQAQLKEIAATKSSLEVKIKELETKSQGVELGEVVVSPEPSAPVTDAKNNMDAVSSPKADNPSAKAKGLEGKVMIINKDYNFAVINLGNKDGVQSGNIFSVYHGNKSIGDLKVEKVHDSMSAAGFGSPEMKDLIAEGDTVKQK